MMTIFILTNGILMEVVNGISVGCGERLWLAVLPARLYGLRGERKALMTTDICAGSGAEIIIKMKLQSRYGETIYK